MATSWVWDVLGRTVGTRCCGACDGALSSLWSLWWGGLISVVPVMGSTLISVVPVMGSTHLCGACDGEYSSLWCL